MNLKTVFSLTTILKKYGLLLIGFTLGLNSCTHTNSSFSQKKRGGRYRNAEMELFKIQSDSTNGNSHKVSTDNYVKIIAATNEMHNEHIGITGSTSEVYKAYESLKENCSFSELYPLLKHDSSAVRVYAYQAIVSKDSTQQERAWKELKGKDDLITTFSGCIKMRVPINMLRVF